ncbi:hypothetical protein THRCLA_11810 [Thraustotheca clavata]|uniref:Uncharacterized protein n=1 Tax=Thraustotheca clavata TaxID=74557 RepID=A0A1V9Y6J9_9STRA|nr:hypothetical protein THRCLA_11810 [Thraustotheca clavata]
MLVQRRWLQPHVAQSIGTFLDNANDLFIFLLALPPTVLTPPLSSLIELAKLVPISHLWPTNDGFLRSLQDHPEWRVLAQKTIELYPVVTIPDTLVPWIYPVLPSTNVRVSLSTPLELQAVMEHWVHRLTSIELLLHDDMYMFEMQWTDEHLKTLCQAVKTAPTLTSMRLSWHLTPSFEPILQSIYKSKLTQIELSYERINAVLWNEIMASEFATWITTQPITRVALTNLDTVDEIATQLLIDGLLTSNSIRSLQIHGGLLSHDLFTWHCSFPTNLIQLDLKFNSSDCITGMAAALVNTKLQILQLELTKPCNMNAEIERLVQTTLPTLHDLRTLHLKQCPLTKTCCVTLSLLLPRYNDVHLQRNDLTDTHVMTLTSYLEQCQWLQSLALIDQAYGDISCLAIAQALTYCYGLRTLSLCGNNIGHAGAIALFKSKPKQLNTLLLNKNPIANEFLQPQQEEFLEFLCLKPNLPQVDEIGIIWT